MFHSGDEEEAHAQQKERQEHSQHAQPDDGDEDGDNGIDYDGWPPWEQGHQTSAVEADGRATRKTTGGRRDRSRRNLQDAEVDVEPAVESPLSCISAGDSVLFDISSGCYPVYEKDSLLNSNVE